MGWEPDFLFIIDIAKEVPREVKAKIALIVKAVVVLPVMMGWITIYIAVVIGAVF